MGVLVSRLGAVLGVGWGFDMYWRVVSQVDVAVST